MWWLCIERELTSDRWWALPRGLPNPLLQARKGRQPPSRWNALSPRLPRKRRRPRNGGEHHYTALKPRIRGCGRHLQTMVHPRSQGTTDRIESSFRRWQGSCAGLGRDHAHLTALFNDLPRQMRPWHIVFLQRLLTGKTVATSKQSREM